MIPGKRIRRKSRSRDENPSSRLRRWRRSWCRQLSRYPLGKSLDSWTPIYLIRSHCQDDFGGCRAGVGITNMPRNWGVRVNPWRSEVDLIPMQLAVECSCCGVPSGCECETSHLTHFSQNESLVYSTQLHYFHKMQNTAFIPSQDTQERIAHESLLRLLT